MHQCTHTQGVSISSASRGLCCHVVGLRGLWIIVCVCGGQLGEQEWTLSHSSGQTHTSGRRNMIKLTKRVDYEDLQIDRRGGKNKKGQSLVGHNGELCSVTKISLYFLVNNSSRISSRLLPCCGRKTAWTENGDEVKFEKEKRILFTLSPPQVLNLPRKEMQISSDLVCVCAHACECVQLQGKEASRSWIWIVTSPFSFCFHVFSLQQQLWVSFPLISHECRNGFKKLADNEAAK